MKLRCKLLSFVLALLMTIPFFASCNSGKTGSGDTENRQTQETEEKQETKVSQDTEQTESLTSAVTKADAEQEYKPNIPQTNYDDEFYLLIQPSSNVFEYHWVEESGNDLLTQAIFERQQKVQEHLLLTPEEATQSVASFLSSREVTVEKILRKLLNDVKNRE